MVKVDRSMPAPKSLAIEKAKKNGTYNTPEVVDRLVADFSDKCYLCEIKPLLDYNIEHLQSHKNGKFKDLKFDWNNLFLSCPHCNKEKNKSEFDSGIIDCCTDNPEELLEFDYLNEQAVIKAIVEVDEKASKTAKLLNMIYNDSEEGMKVYESKARTKALQQEMNKFYKVLMKYMNNSNDALVNRLLKVLLDRKSAFAAFKRQYIRDNRDMFPELLGLLK